MRFSRSIKSSAQSLPSPNGAYIATILPGKLTIRVTRSLEISRVITLPPDFTSSVYWLIWSPSARRVLLSTTELIRVFSVVDERFVGIISNPTSGTPQITYIAFGATDDEICVVSDFGLKLTIFNLVTSTSVDISCPKLFNPINASKGYSYRPQTSNLALLTRGSGKDIVSIHSRTSYEVLRSWHPDTIDASQVSWSPDGKWLAVVESASQGHKILFYTADGHLYRSWRGPMRTSNEGQDITMGAGVKLIAWNSIGDCLAVADYSSNVTLLSSPWLTETMSLKHTTIIKPTSTLQIWQEHVALSQYGGFDRTFALSKQTSCPPTVSSPPGTKDASARSGTSMVAFDASGTLIATRPECMPTSVWIWDIATQVLKSVMIQHAPVAEVVWHPAINELLLIRCEGDESRGLVYFWEPSWETPKVLDFESQIPGGKIIGKSAAMWLNVESPLPAMFFSDTQDFILTSISESEDASLPWEDDIGRELDIYGGRDESPLNLVPADQKRPRRRNTIESLMNDDPTIMGMSGYGDEIDDTFQFKKVMET